MSDKYAAAEKLLLNAQEVTNQLRHLAEKEIDSDSFAVVTENYNGRETEFERPITDLAIDAANLVDAMVDALELRDKRILELLAERDADKRRIAELEARASAHDRLCDSNYIAGMKTGWNLGIANDNAGFNQCLAARVRRWPDDSDSLKIEGE